MDRQRRKVRKLRTLMNSNLVAEEGRVGVEFVRAGVQFFLTDKTLGKREIKSVIFVGKKPPERAETGLIIVKGLRDCN